MPHYCAYSFADLFQAAQGRPFSKKEEQTFAALNQTDRNQQVRQLAEKAGWQYKNITSYEGDVFTAFWPRQRAKKKARRMASF